jgi:hypothetical protein
VIAVAERTFGVLTIVAAVIAVGTLVALLRRDVPAWLRDLALPTATGIATVATGGSLLLSEVAGYIPCTLCWYQRIAMYPLVIVLGVASWRRDRQVWRMAVPIAAIGLVIAIWHVAIERRPALGGVCDPMAPCSLRWVEEFGLLTLPMMAGTGFIAIILLTLAARPGSVEETADEDDIVPHAEV